MDFFKHLICKVLDHKWVTVQKSIWKPWGPYAEQHCKRCGGYRNVLRLAI
jgi:hypothetical protein